MPGVSRHASSEVVEKKHPGPSPKLLITLEMGVNHNTSSYVYPFHSFCLFTCIVILRLTFSSFDLVIFRDNYIPVRVVNCTSSQHCELLKVVMYHIQKMEHFYAAQSVPHSKPSRATHFFGSLVPTVWVIIKV